MILECHACGATYNVADDKVSGRRVRVRCKHCSAGIIVDGREIRDEDATRQISLEDTTRQMRPRDVLGAPRAAGLEPAGFGEEDATRVMTSPLAGGAPAAPAARPPAPATEWIVNSSDGEQRTMRLDEIVDGYNSGRLDEDAYAWKDGMSDWVPVFEVPEIRAAIDSESATRVVDPARVASAPSAPLAYGSPVAAYAPRASHPAFAPPPSKPAYAPPAAPPAAIEPDTDVEYAPPVLPPQSNRPAPQARMRGGRGGRVDLFESVEIAGSENELLASDSDPLLEQYSDRPTGARSESSVLFSLDALKAVKSNASSSAPPRPATAAPHTAAEILGMGAPSGAAPEMSGDVASLTSPAASSAPPAPPPSAAPLSAATRAKLDTTPPTARRSNNTIIIWAAALTGVAFIAVATFIVMARRDRQGAEALQTTESTPPTAARQQPAEPAAGAAEAKDDQGSNEDSEEPAPSPDTERASRETEKTERPSQPSKPASPPRQTAPKPAPAPVAQRDPKPAEPQSAPEPAAPDPVASSEPEPEPEPEPEETGGMSALEAAMRGAATNDKGGSSDAPKVDLAESEPADDSEPEPPKEEEPPKPPFNAGAAKTALVGAAANAASCKKPDGPTGSGKVQVTFANSGRATSANIVAGPFGGTAVGGCVARIFRSASVPPFSGAPVTVAKSFKIPD